MLCAYAQLFEKLFCGAKVWRRAWNRKQLMISTHGWQLHLRCNVTFPWYMSKLTKCKLDWILDHRSYGFWFFCLMFLFLFIRSSGFLFIQFSGFGLLDQLDIFPWLKLLAFNVTIFCFFVEYYNSVNTKTWIKFDFSFEEINFWGVIPKLLPNNP